MTVVAVAGGTGDLGQTIVEAIANTGKHTIYVLTRKVLQSIPTHPLASIAELVVLDYENPESIREVLDRLQVDTVISTLNLNWPGSAQSQLNLIRGSAQSKLVKRFIPSEFNIDYNVSEEWELQGHPNLTYTLIRNGFFLDYLGLPFGETHLHPLYCLLDLQAAKAAIPGDGSMPVVFTHTTDVAKFVATLLDIPAAKWPLESAVIGERILLNDLVSLAEKATGKTVSPRLLFSLWLTISAGRQFTKSFDPVEGLRKMQTTELLSNKQCYSYFPGGKAELDMVISTMMVGMATGVFDISGTDLRTFAPETALTKIEPFLRSCWAEAGHSVPT
ncbi:uncharacterized protein A1O9_01693 [Exophiala aquamarina CBS 119918]|uniref:NmrA-like domain-containing protein n=1 Tax=Exophiala aquamarina CBS 119918 TaxID=1182545 RepID=A0A072Q702_9EURO|nr:uncharacterized protein A1O9_01693 [Exophiala aquamarina CBS 119918]KEF63715.1 hypothetical protein A1O9_01693 [Exophiala aquamarina CBS 119918]